MRRYLALYPFLLLLLPLLLFILIQHVVERSAKDGLLNTDEHTSLYAVVSSHPVERPKTWSVTATALPDRPVRLYFAKTDSLPAVGDSVFVYTHGSFVPPRGDWVGYFVTSWTLVSHDLRPWYTYAKGWQYHLVDRYRRLGIDGPELGTLSALTLGYRDDLDTDIRQAFANAGAMHILAVSGLHTGIFLLILWQLFTLFGLCRPLYDRTGHRWLLVIGISLILWAYAFITGATPSVVRSVIMCMLGLVAYACHRQVRLLNVLSAAAFFILLFRPNDLFTPSFLLSFFAVGALIVWSPVLNRFLPPNSIVSASVAAQLGVAPLGMYFFGSLSVCFLLTNIVVVPGAYVLMILGLLTLVLGGVPYIGTCLVWLTDHAVSLLNRFVVFVEHLPGATLTCSLSLIQTVLLYIFLTCLLLLFRLRSK